MRTASMGVEKIESLNFLTLWNRHCNTQTLTYTETILRVTKPVYSRFQTASYYVFVGCPTVQFCHCTVSKWNK